MSSADEQIFYTACLEDDLSTVEKHPALFQRSIKGMDWLMNQMPDWADLYSIDHLDACAISIINDSYRVFCRLLGPFCPRLVHLQLIAHYEPVKILKFILPILEQENTVTLAYFIFYIMAYKRKRCFAVLLYSRVILPRVARLVSLFETDLAIACNCAAIKKHLLSRKLVKLKLDLVYTDTMKIGLLFFPLRLPALLLCEILDTVCQPYSNLQSLHWLWIVQKAIVGKSNAMMP